jgi:hypothetical protein
MVFIKLVILRDNITQFINLRDMKTGLNAPLYGNENDTKEANEYNQDWSVNYWLLNNL